MDPLYTEQRNALIPDAELVANRLSGAAPNPLTHAADWDHWAGVWNGHFHAAMERLWKRRQGGNVIYLGAP
jgi:hypothetical protein